MNAGHQWLHSHVLRDLLITYLMVKNSKIMSRNFTRCYPDSVTIRLLASCSTLEDKEVGKAIER